MTIECFFIAWNEAETIHLTIKHYQQFCSKIVVYDNFSTDNTREIAESMGCEVRLFGIEGQLNDAEYLKVKNNCWKGSKADWVIVCDADEILFNPKIDLFHATKAGATIISTQGYNMFSEIVPRESWMEVKTGVKDDNYSKYICFDPKPITDINYEYGCHKANPKGYVTYYYYDIPLKLLHYKHIGGAKRLADRHAMYAGRLSTINRKWKLGHQYTEHREQTIKYFNDQLALCKEVF